MAEKTGLIGWEEAMELLNESKDHLMLNQLLNHANFVVVGCFQTDNPNELPIVDFDLHFYLRVIKEFSGDLDFLRAVLKGEDVFRYSGMMKVRASKKLVSAAVRTDESKFYNLLGHHLSLPVSFAEKMVTEGTDKFVRSTEALRLLDSVDNSITATLMHFANHLALRDITSKPQEIARIDYYFFMRAIQEFCSSHDFLRRVLEGADLRWFSENDEASQLIL